MSELVIVGCPYTSMRNLYEAFKEFNAKDVTVINCDQITALDANSIWIREEIFHVSEVTRSFIRYPYDLIPPHSATYRLREETEYFKSVALLFDHVAINALSSTWVLRNRVYSLNEAKLHGANIAYYKLIKKFDPELINKEMAVKALGNCFITENKNDIHEKAQEFSVVAEDDGDYAAVFQASLLSLDKIKAYSDCFGPAFTQDPIDSNNEFRGYLIGDEIYIYLREKISSFDKSAAKYLKTSYVLSDAQIDALKGVMAKFRIGFLCFDFILDENDTEFVIDINPYGSMPKYSEHSEPSMSLARLLLGAQ